MYEHTFMCNFYMRGVSLHVSYYIHSNVYEQGI